ncbi:MAG: glutamine-hydrolyzing carbamoyl-phosphate synthase small subunit [Thermaerobacter sp.]|nr:glutamine-hydrolyzing carbamoyl-phosphate synthase small subunit [Thermaerobacter sp.]
MSKEERAYLELQDGSIYPGVLVGDREVEGEVVFTTAMTGYGEVVTDASYAGQIVVMTFPEIGIYGVDPAALEAKTPRARGLVVRQLQRVPSHASSKVDLPGFLAQAGVPILTDVDTRALTRRLRTAGTMSGRIARAPRGGVGDADCQLVRQMATKEAYWFSEDGKGPKVAVVDFGLKEDILRQLAAAGARVLVLPPTTPPEEIDRAGVDGVLLTNGPGDPSRMPEFAALAHAIAERHPTLGICLGHQLLALGYGARTFKLPFGHRGANHPVGHLDGRPGEVTSQNHGYAVDAGSLQQTPLEVSEVHLNDGTVEGLRHRTRPVLSVQYHPEAGPGPWEARGVFGRFLHSLGGDA